MSRSMRLDPAVVGPEFGCGCGQGAACRLLWHVKAIDDFARRWLRRGYQSGEVVLNGTVRGKLTLSQYVKRYVSTGQNQNVPCCVTMRTHDTPNNRLLKAGLRRPAVRHDVN